MNEAARYVKVIEWSDDDQCFIGSCPGLFYGGCHGDSEKMSSMISVRLWRKRLRFITATASLYLLPPAEGIW